MVSIARKNLFQERTRLIISVGGVAFAVFLIIVILGLYQGWNKRLASYVEKVQADLWVMQLGTTDMFHSYSLVSKQLDASIREVESVKDVIPFIGRRVVFEYNGEEQAMFLVGVDPARPVNGPTELVRGTLTPADGEILVDAVFAKRQEVDLGDTLTINNHDLKVAGIVRGGNMVVFQYAFTTLAEAERVLHLGAPPAPPGGTTDVLPVVTDPNIANYLLVQANPGQAEDVLATLKEKLPNQLVRDKADFAFQNGRIIRDSFLPIIYVLNVVAFLTGIAVIGLTIYTATVEKAQEFGVLKAIGASSWHLFRIVLTQSFISAVFGYVLGVGIALGASELIVRLEPAFITYYRVGDVALVSLAAIGMSLVASYIPMRRLIKIDPANVFRA